MAHAKASTQTSTPPYSLQRLNLLQWFTIGHPLQRHPFSGLLDSAGELLHTP